MSIVYLKHGESIDNLIKRFEKSCQMSGIRSEVKKREYYEKPSERRKKKQIAAQKRRAKRR